MEKGNEHAVQVRRASKMHISHDAVFWRSKDSSDRQ